LSTHLFQLFQLLLINLAIWNYSFFGRSEE
jgi:hypothetical protein